MKKLIFAIAAFASIAAHAGAFTIYIRLPSGKIHQVEAAKIPDPDKYGRYTFRLKEEKTTIIVDSSNVWIMSN